MTLALGLRSLLPLPQCALPWQSALVMAVAPAACRKVLLSMLSLVPGSHSLRTRFENSDVTKDPKTM